jgi:hypothetical protein
MAKTPQVKLSQARSYDELSAGARQIHQNVQRDLGELRAELKSAGIAEKASATRLEAAATSLADLQATLTNPGSRGMDPGGSSPGGSSPGGSSPGGSSPGGSSPGGSSPGGSSPGGSSPGGSSPGGSSPGGSSPGGSSPGGSSPGGSSPGGSSPGGSSPGGSSPGGSSPGGSSPGGSSPGGSSPGGSSPGGSSPGGHSPGGHSPGGSSGRGQLFGSLAASLEQIGGELKSAVSDVVHELETAGLAVSEAAGRLVAHAETLLGVNASRVGGSGSLEGTSPLDSKSLGPQSPQ